MITLKEIRQALTRGYYHSDNARKEVDVALIEAMADEVMAALAAAEASKNLQGATNKGVFNRWAG